MLIVYSAIAYGLPKVEDNAMNRLQQHRNITFIDAATNKNHSSPYAVHEFCGYRCKLGLLFILPKVIIWPTMYYYKDKIVYYLPKWRK